MVIDKEMQSALEAECEREGCEYANEVGQEYGEPALCIHCGKAPMLNVVAALKTLAIDLDRSNARYSRITLEDITSQVERALLEIDTACDGAADPKLCALRARFLLTGPKA